MSRAAPNPPGFADHFSRDSASYAEFRPRYPAALFEWLAQLPPARRLVWDVASDASIAQLRARSQASGVHYLAEQGEISAVATRRADLVTVAQAYHWLDHQRFHAEVDRVLVPDGVFAVWCYGVLSAESEIDDALARFYHDTVGAYWPKERVHVEQGYRHFKIPIAEVSAPRLSIETHFTLPQLLGYLGTWSAVGRYMQANGHDPVPGFGEELAGLWGDPTRARRIEWPISVRAGRWLGSGSPAA